MAKMTPSRVQVLTINIDGRSITYARPEDGRDPQEVTLGEWRAYPALTSVALLDRFFAGRAALAKEGGQ